MSMDSVSLTSKRVLSNEIMFTNKTKQEVKCEGLFRNRYEQRC